MVGHQAPAECVLLEFHARFFFIWLLLGVPRLFQDADGRARFDTTFW
jgi:hypothetical protein